VSNKENDSDSLPACAVEYVQRVLKKMRYRRKVRDEVKAELMAHFEDELNDCKIDEEKEEKARALLSDFGDLKLLAILLRRAKKRCRPLWRTITARTFQAIGVLIVCFIFYVIWFSFGEPTIRVDYIRQLDRMNQPQVRDEDNAWPHYEKAISLYVKQSPLVGQFISCRHSSKKREEALRLKNLINEQQVQTWLKKNQNHWDNFSPEQQTIVLKCFEYNWVPFPKTSHRMCNQWHATTFQRMTEHTLTCIRNETELTTPHQCGALPGVTEPDFPYSELKSWQTNSQIPPNFLEAVSVAVLREGMTRFREPSGSDWSPLTDTECEYISPWIKQNEAAWREFAAGALKPYCYKAYQYYPNGRDHWFGIVEPQIPMLRKLAWLGIWRSRIDMKQGQIRQGFEDCLTVARAGSHWQGKGRIGQQFSGQSMSRLALQEILHIATTENLLATDLKQLQQQLSRIYPEGYPHMNMEAERLAFLDTVQRVFTDEGFGGGHLIPDRYIQIFEPRAYDDSKARMVVLPLTTPAGMVHARRDETIRKGNEIYDQLNQMCKMTPYERYTREIDDEIHLSLSREKYLLIHRLMRATYLDSESTYRSEALYQATIVTLALKRWRLAKNEYPGTLNELVAAGFLKSLPMDPYSDKPLIYRRADDGFILYSVGPDFTDDAGQYGVDRYGQARKWTDNGDTVFWPLLTHQARSQQ
jgi:hypothetical protein